MERTTPTRATKHYNLTFFQAAKEEDCALCHNPIHTGKAYARVEPRDKKKESFRACMDCVKGIDGGNKLKYKKKS